MATVGYLLVPHAPTWQIASYFFLLIRLSWRLFDLWPGSLGFQHAARFSITNLDEAGAVLFLPQAEGCRGRKGQGRGAVDAGCRLIKIDTKATA